MYESLPSFVLGFHGCDEAIAEQVFAGAVALKPSTNDYDWLGHGIYFWESNPQRALAYAKELSERPRKEGAKVRHPAVIGAVIDFQRCLNLLDHEMIGIVRDAYHQLRDVLAAAGASPPVNKGGIDLLRRYLDCAVLEYLHQRRAESEDAGEPFDTVRSVFLEGSPIYPGAGFHEKSHIQICVRSPRCIKGYFRVLPEPA